MVVVGFGVLFAGVVSSVLAGATISLLLAFILPVSLAGPVSSIPDRLAGWGLAAGGVAARDRRCCGRRPRATRCARAAIAACRALAARLRSEVAFLLGGEGGGRRAEHDEAIAGARATVGCAARRVPRDAVPADRPEHRRADGRAARRRAELAERDPRAGVAASARAPGRPGARCAVKVAAAAALERGADLLELHGGRPDELRAALAELREALAAIEQHDRASTQPGRASPVHAVIVSARPELPRAGAELRRLADRAQHRPDRGRRAAQLAGPPARPPARRAWRGRCRRAGAGRRPPRPALRLAAQQRARRGRPRRSPSSSRT